MTPDIKGSDYLEKLNFYQSAQVREYWIVDPSIGESGGVFVYQMGESGFSLHTYSFRDKIPVGFCDDLTIDFREIDNGE